METVNNAAIIMLSGGAMALVDIEDYEKITSMGVWTVHSGGYAYRNDYPKGKAIFMHRVINNTPEGMETDNINGCRTDNRKCNLKNATRKENAENRHQNRRKLMFPELPDYMTFDTVRKRYIVKNKNKGIPHKGFKKYEDALEYLKSYVEVDMDALKLKEEL